MVGLVETDDVTYQILRAVYLGLVVVHLSLLEVVKGGRKDLGAQIGDPLFEFQLVDLSLPLFQKRQLEDDLSVSGLDLMRFVQLVHLFQQFLERSDEGL